MNTDYTVLGLKEGASQAEIKKAYFKMVRLHSPESDPEQFQIIRQAYERLKNAKNKADGPVFPPLSDPWAVKMLQQIQLYRSEKNMPLYRDACEEAWKRFPNDIHFLYLLIMAQRRCGNTGKAVKNAELLVSKDPKNKWYQMALAFSYMDRGFTQKAFAACETAYELGCRDIDFLIMYGSACDNNCQYEQGVRVLLDVIQQDKRWSREEVPKLMDAYFGLLSMNYYSSTDILSDILDSLYHFLEQYSIYAKEYMTKLSYWLSNICSEIPYNSAAYKKTEQIFALALQTCRDNAEKEQIHSSIELYYFQRVSSDPRIGELLISYLELLHDIDDEEFETDELIKKYAAVDLQLCMIEQREETLNQIAVLKQDHPQEYEKIGDFIRKLENKPKLPIVKDSLLKTFRRLEPLFTSSRYYELYPQEKIRAAGTPVYTGPENEPYIRTAKKIGRNDPCPCGSGKKYKHCCMNK